MHKALMSVLPFISNVRMRNTNQGTTHLFGGMVTGLVCTPAFDKRNDGTSATEEMETLFSKLKLTG